jgi:hypothetical protein
MTIDLRRDMRTRREVALPFVNRGKLPVSTALRRKGDRRKGQTLGP